MRDVTIDDVGGVDDSVEGDVSADEFVVTLPMEPSAPDSKSVKNRESCMIRNKTLGDFVNNPKCRVTWGPADKGLMRSFLAFFRLSAAAVKRIHSGSSRDRKATEDANDNDGEPEPEQERPKPPPPLSFTMLARRLNINVDALTNEEWAALKRKMLSSMLYTLGELVRSKTLCKTYDTVRGEEGLNWPDEVRNAFLNDEWWGDLTARAHKTPRRRRPPAPVRHNVPPILPPAPQQSQRVPPIQPTPPRERGRLFIQPTPPRERGSPFIQPVARPAALPPNDPPVVPPLVAGPTVVPQLRLEASSGRPRAPYQPHQGRVTHSSTIRQSAGPGVAAVMARSREEQPPHPRPELLDQVREALGDLTAAEESLRQSRDNYVDAHFAALDRLVTRPGIPLAEVYRVLASTAAGPFLPPSTPPRHGQAGFQARPTRMETARDVYAAAYRRREFGIGEIRRILAIVENR
ncbi:hypothetical protein CMUS01_09554 [Colletotrichum musicola]|uniref:Uncharacterized protein n=1 Tax=Colletotrichum musicola TaxID=2175873 RepID=A0A8H6NAA5_9PEZI|nr:hypothetical protein CMUS01_09554 [Colletotrichum musicola]